MCKTEHHLAEDGTLKGSCISCPFNDGVTFEASEGQNLGCLPSGYDIIQMKRRSGQNWACHDDESKVCSGLCHSAKDAGLDLSEGGLVRYSSWYHAGEEAAVDEARTGYLVQQLTGHYFDMAVEGYRYGNGSCQEPTHFSPCLKYYYPRTGAQRLMSRDEDSRVFFTVSTAPERCEDTGRMLRRFVGLLELESFSQDRRDIGLKYITVDPAHQQKGLAAKMLALAIEHLQKTRQALHVSYATDEGKLKFQAHLQRELDANFITWTQSPS